MCKEETDFADPPTPTTTTPEAPSATLIVHVSDSGAPDENAPLEISKLRGDGEAVSSFRTSEHAVHVAPGTYEVVALQIYNPTTVSFVSRKQVTVTAGQELDVTLEVTS